MKKVNYVILLVILLISSCSNEECSKSYTSEFDGNEKDLAHFYGIAYPEVLNTTRGIAERIKLWYPGSIIKIKFLNDPYNMADQIKIYASEWEKYAGIHFEFVETGDAHVRIGFDWNDERYITWSYVGTDCKMVTDQNEATMSFAYWDSSNERDMQGDILRAFGQVLGLELEHRHLDFDPGWTNRIASYWEGEIQDIPWESLQKYVFSPLVERESIQSSYYDEESIMIWPFSTRYAKNTGRSFNYQLSQKDKEFIAKLYPQNIGEAIMTATTLTRGYYEVELNFVGEYFMNWGNGETQYESMGNDESLHKQAVFSSYYDNDINIFKLFGDAHAVSKLKLNRYGLLSALDISKMSNLEELYISESKLTKLDITQNTNLRNLACINNLLTELDFNGYPYLEEVDCIENQLKTLNFTNCDNLRKIYCYYNQLEYLDLSGCKNLASIICYGNKLDSINTLANPALVEIECQNNNINFLDISNNPNLLELQCYNNNIKELDLRNNPELGILECSSNQIQSLDLSHNSLIYSISCKDNPLVLNSESLLELAQSLPDRNGQSQGRIQVGRENITYPFRDACWAKNWIVW